MKKIYSIVVITFILFLSPVSLVLAYDSWLTKSSLPEVRSSMGTTSVNDQIYIIGGRSTDGTVTNKVEVYDPLTDSWVTKTSMPTAREHLGVTSVNGKIYAIGGIDNNGTVLNTVEIYDPKIDSWTTSINMPTARYGLGVATINDKIYSIGGRDNSGLLDIVEEYDPITGTWISKTSMKKGKSFFATATINGMIYTFGGEKKNGVLKTVEAYDPNTDTWISKAGMLTKRAFFGAVVANEKIYAVGGGDNGVLNTMEEYDSLLDTWVTRASMPTSRSYLGVAVANNKVYAIGGFDGTSNLNVVEEYTPLLPIASAPTNLIANAGDGQVDITWDSSLYAETYIIKRSFTLGGPYTTIASNVIATAYTDTSLSNGTTYYYVVTAGNATGESENSNEVSATPFDIPTQAPVNLTATPVSNEVTLAWDQVSDTDLAGYNIYLDGVLIDTVTTTSYTVTGLTNGQSYTFEVSAVDISGNESTRTQITATPSVMLQTPILTIEANDIVTGGTEFTVDVAIDNAINLYAEDITVQYDTNLFEFIQAEPANPGLKIYYQEKPTAGQLRFIVASLGETNDINGNQQLLKLTFKAKMTTGTGDIAVIYGLVADGNNNEIVANVSGTSITVQTGYNADVNGDGNYTLGDLAIAGKHYNMDPIKWLYPTSDVNIDNAVTDIDLSLIVDAILNGN